MNYNKYTYVDIYVVNNTGLKYVKLIFFIHL